MIKLPGKTAYAGVRRKTTRKSGFKSHPDSTGREFKTELVKGYVLEPDVPLIITYDFPQPKENVFIGFGGFYKSDSPLSVEIENSNANASQNPISNYNLPNTSKFGSMWWAEGGNERVIVTIISPEPNVVYLYNLECGLIWHEAFDAAITAEVLSPNTIIRTI